MIYIISDNGFMYNDIEKHLKLKNIECCGINLLGTLGAHIRWVSLEECRNQYSDEIIICAIRNNKIRSEALKLLKENGFPTVRILDFVKTEYAYLPRLRADRKMLELNGKHPEGLILGISHALAGIKPKYMGHTCLNLAMWSQDIFYNKCVLEYVLENYPQYFDKLKYVAIDMFDYTYFNYDTSLSGNIIAYLENGGANWEPHNYALNSEFASDFDWNSLNESLELMRIEGLTSEHLDIWDEYFSDYHELTSYSDISDPDIVEFATDETLIYKYGSLLTTIFENTVNENVKLFDELLKRIEQINPKINVYVMLLPRYYGTYELDLNNSQVNYWKEQFYRILSNLRENHQIELLDFNGCDMSVDRNNYMEAGHFNAFGAYRFTRMFEEIITASWK